MNEIRRWVRQGRTVAWTAYQLNVTTEHVTAFMRDHGIERPPDPVLRDRNRWEQAAA